MNIRSLKFKIVVLPLILVFVAFSVIGISTSLLVRDNLIDVQRQNGFELLNQIKSRVRDNNSSLENINEILEEEMRATAEEIIDNRENLSSEYLTEIGLHRDIDIIDWYDSDRRVAYANNTNDLGWIPSDDHPLTEFSKSSESELMEGIRRDAASVDGDYYKWGAIKSPDGGFIQFGINANKVSELTSKYDYQTLVEELAESKAIAYAGFIDPNGIIIADGDKEMIGKVVPNKKIEDFIKAKKEAAILATSFTGTRVYEMLSPIETNGKYTSAIKVAFDMTETYNAIKKNIIIITTLGLVSFLILSLILTYLSRGILRNLTNTRHALNALSGGDFTHSISDDFLKQNDEFGEMSLSIKHLQDSMRSTIKSIANSSQNVTSASEAVCSASKDSAIVTEEISKTIEEIANGANTQADDTERGSMNIIELGDLIDKNQENISQLVEISNDVSLFKDQGLESIEELLKGTYENKNSVECINKLIMNTSASAEKIENASDMIKGISEQTNLLALNAAIEAARAGEAGRGFAVVADEIRKLAEMSNKFTEEISHIITDLIEKTDETVKNIKQVEESTDVQVRNVKTTNDKFECISESVEKMLNALEEVDNSSRIIDDKKEEIIRVIENLSAISQENAAATEEASASIEEQLSSVSQIEEATETLKQISRDMQENIEKLKY